MEERSSRLKPPTKGNSEDDKILSRSNVVEDLWGDGGLAELEAPGKPDPSDVLDLFVLANPLHAGRDLKLGGLEGVEKDRHTNQKLSAALCDPIVQTSHSDELGQASLVVDTKSKIAVFLVTLMNLSLGRPNKERNVVLVVMLNAERRLVNLAIFGSRFCRLRRRRIGP